MMILGTELPDKLVAMIFEYLEALRQTSPDTSSKIGAMILHPTNPPTEHDIAGWVSQGVNTFPEGLEITCERLERPIKYDYTEHAERNAIYSAAQSGHSTEGGIMFLLGFGPPTVPCIDCARAVIQAGIKAVVGKAYKPVTDNWIESLDKAKAMLEEAGIEFIEYTG